MNIQYICFTGRSGFSNAAMNYVAALETAGHHVSITSIDRPPSSWAKGKPTSPIKNSIQIYHCIPEMFRRVKRKGRSIAIATFETLDPPKTWFHLLNKHSVVVVPSKFCETTFAPVKSPIYKIPHCLGPKWFDAAPKQVDDIFRFLWVGAWRKRKGWRILLEAWAEAFAHNEKVELVMKTDDVAQAKGQLGAWQRRHKKAMAPVRLLGGKKSEDDMIDLFCRSNCLVAPSLGEGFGYAGLQGMAVGLSVILTDYAGHTEYATWNNSILIPPEKLHEEHFLDRISQFKHRKWASPSPTFLCEAMKDVFRERGCLAAIDAKESVQDVFSTIAVGKLWDKMLREKFI